MNQRIPTLLQEAKRQEDSPSTGESSVTSARRPFQSPVEAERFFEQLRQELFRVSEWNGKAALSSFELFDEKGERCSRPVQAGDFIRVRMTGSGKDDWVRVINLVDQAGEAIVTIKPSRDPTEKESDKAATSHFFTSEATNNLCLEKSDAAVSFYVIGLSEKTNTAETESLLEKTRNVAVANIGSYFGIQKGEWKKFCANFLRLKDQD